jgi:type II secretory pathway pseudopilin PulG
MVPGAVLRRRSPAAAGFSVVEVLIAAAIFLIIAVGILPLFTRAMNSNLIGNDYMNAANHGRSGLENFMQVDFESPNLTLDPGATSKDFVDYWTAGDPNKAGDEKWVTTVPAGQLALWTRTGTVRQYGISALADGNLETSEALPGGTDATFVHLKEVRMTVQSTRGGGPLGGGKTVTLRVLRAF